MLFFDNYYDDYELDFFYFYGYYGAYYLDYIDVAIGYGGVQQVPNQVKTRINPSSLKRYYTQYKSNGESSSGTTEYTVASTRLISTSEFYIESLYPEWSLILDDSVVNNYFQFSTLLRYHTEFGAYYNLYGGYYYSYLNIL